VSAACGSHRPQRSGRWPLHAVRCLALGVWILAGALPAAERTPLRVTISRTLFEDVNRNDAEAAIKVWGGVIAAERGVAVDPQARIVEGAAEMRNALRERRVELVGLRVDEFESLRGEFRFSDLFVSVLAGGAETTYLLVTHREGGRARLADLAGAKLGIYGNSQMALAEPWLAVELARAGLPGPAAHFAALQRHQKPAKAILPVFFRQTEAALVSQRSFETMIELNPQLGRSLQVIARSPAVLPMVFALVEGIEPVLHRQLLQNLPDVHLSAAGRQVLQLMQGERLELVAPGRYDSAWALLAEHRRLVGGAAATQGGMR